MGYGATLPDGVDPVVWILPRWLGCPRRPNARLAGPAGGAMHPGASGDLPPTEPKADRAGQGYWKAVDDVNHEPLRGAGGASDDGPNQMPG